MRLLLLCILLAGCTSMPTIEIYASHMSQPFAGPHSPPIGDNGATHETSANMIGTLARWQRGRAFVETSLDYDLSNQLEGGPWMVEARMGWVVAGK